MRINSGGYFTFNGANTNSDVIQMYVAARGASPSRFGLPTGSAFINGTATGANLPAIGFGTSDSGYVVFGTNDLERMRITSAGDIQTKGGTVYFGASNTGDIFVSPSNQSMYYEYPTGYNAIFRTQAGSEAMRINSSGQVGINTSSQNTWLSIGGASTTISGYTPASLFVTQSTGDMVAGIRNSHPSNPFGMQIAYTAASPNSSGNEFLQCVDAGPTVRIQLRSNGGIGNYSANNVNLSDERTKKDIQYAGNYLDKICAIPVRTFLYKDQKDNELNLGVIAQEVEAVAPELVDALGFGETPEDGVPLKAIYQTDLQYALMKAIQELNAKVNAQALEIQALKRAK
jgi:hypothetical protein